MSGDKETLSVYDSRADDYASMALVAEQETMLSSFIKAMPEHARVLDLGCGPGFAAAEMNNANLQTDAFDASPVMVRLASQHSGVNVQIKTFEQLDAQNIYHGIWASFSLLHAPKLAFPGHLEAIHAALVPGGVLHLGMKLGQGEKRDRLGRFYAYYSQSELENHLDRAGFTPTDFVLRESEGLSGDIVPSIMINARA